LGFGDVEEQMRIFSIRRITFSLMAEKEDSLGFIHQLYF